jgi:hypothetical protein
MCGSFSNFQNFLSCLDGSFVVVAWLWLGCGLVVAWLWLGCGLVVARFDCQSFIKLRSIIMMFYLLIKASLYYNVA